MQAQFEKNMTLLSQTDLSIRRDALGMAVWGGHVFVAHPFTGGFAVLDVSDPRKPYAVAEVEPPAATTSLHLQVAEGILLLGREANSSLVGEFARAGVTRPRPGMSQDLDHGFSPGVAVYDVSKPKSPRQIGELRLDGFGVHRVWWSGGRYATVSTWAPGFADFILGVVDLADPAEPRLVGEWWPAQMDPGAGEAAERWGMHHAIINGDRVFGSWRDGGLHVCDISEPTSPRRIGGAHPSLWGGGMTHTTLPLPGRDLVVVADEAMAANCEDGDRRIWVLDVSDLADPVVLAACPEPAERSYCSVGGRFAPHNLYENRPGAWNSETIIFATYENAGVRVFDISDAATPVEVAAVVPAAPSVWADPRSDGPLVVQSADIFVSTNGIVYFSDLSAGLSIAQLDAT